MGSTKATATIDILKGLFARYGLPHEIVTVNGPQYIAEFKQFVKVGSVKHTLCPPYHSATNGLAEKHVKTFKRMFIKYDGPQLLPHRVADVLCRYRSLPHPATGKTPAELFLKRVPRTRLSLGKPSLQRKIGESQVHTKFQRDGYNIRQNL